MNGAVSTCDGWMAAEGTEPKGRRPNEMHGIRDEQLANKCRAASRERI